MGKNKLARWTEFGSFDNVIQPEIGDVFAKDHPVKGRWNKEIFKNENPVILELGCGKGEYTIGLASRFPGNNYIGIDIKGARMWRGAKTANEQKLPNVAFLRMRIEFINSFFSTDEIDEIWITFPDPHPGGRNSSKRLISPRFLNVYRLFLKNRGIVHLKTDNIELYNYSKKVVSDNSLDLIVSTNDLYSENISDDILSIRTHYEKIFLNEGLKINYLSFRLDKEKIIEDASRKSKS
ncbi:MAG: tRNA (guanosine(46)-N7)-methyltransferase TrmB [Bacteroidia bacterium]|nr:tRNA (guanosine(46)-N7)-methyltransferase TrmB [Bacteroidia bacterium]